MTKSWNVKIYWWSVTLVPSSHGWWVAKISGPNQTNNVPRESFFSTVTVRYLDSIWFHTGMFQIIWIQFLVVGVLRISYYIFAVCCLLDKSEQKTNDWVCLFVSDFTSVTHGKRIMCHPTPPLCQRADNSLGNRIWKTSVIFSHGLSHRSILSYPWVFSRLDPILSGLVRIIHFSRGCLPKRACLAGGRDLATELLSGLTQHVRLNDWSISRSQSLRWRIVVYEPANILYGLLHIYILRSFVELLYWELTLTLCFP